jgi:23S rRNA pseudouridine2605 synthase
MSKFNTKPGDKGRSGSRGDKKPFGKSSDDKDAKGYRAKRSFTKNKDFRESKDTGADKPRRSFGADGEKKTFDRPFKKTYGGDKPERASSRDGERKPYKKEDDKFGDKPRRSYSSSDERKPFKRDGEKDARYGDKPRRTSAGSEERKPFGRDREKESGYGDKPRRTSAGADERKPYSRDKEKEGSDKPRRTFRGAEERKPFKKEFGERSPRAEGDKPKRSYGNAEERKPYKKDFKSGEGRDSVRPVRRSEDSPRGAREERPFKRRASGDSEGPETKRVKYDDFEDGKVFSGAGKKEFKERKPVKKAVAAKPKVDDGTIRLNKYLSNAGIASRREADNLIQSGVVKVNGVVVDQLGSKVNPGDKVTYADAAVRSERKVYLLLNKPKDYITTLDDPQERKTVMELIKGACRERIYPVGRLDRNTTGLLLFTNDGELTTKLTHPKFGVKKVYHVSLNKGLRAEDFSAIVEGVELEDGIVKADDLAFVGEGKKEIGIEIHSGRNRIVRRLFEHLGYEVLKLDRVVFAGLTKKDLPRGKHRFLTGKEIGFLQMIG